MTLRPGVARMSLQSWAHGEAGVPPGRSLRTRTGGAAPGPGPGRRRHGRPVCLDEHRCPCQTTPLWPRNGFRFLFWFRSLMHQTHGRLMLGKSPTYPAGFQGGVPGPAAAMALETRRNPGG